MRRTRNAKIVATLGPASTSRETIEALYKAGADVFRFNFSHGTHADHHARFEIVRALALLLSTLIFFSVLKIVPLAEGSAMMKYPARRFLLFRTGLSLGETIGSLFSLPLPLSICIVLSPSDRACTGP